MLDATSCLAGLCFCLLAISAAAPPSTIFCRSFLPLLLFGFPLFARFLIPSQAKPVAVKRHKKRARLKTAAVVKDSIGASVQMSLSNNYSHTILDSFACHTKWISDGSAIFAEWPESQQEAFVRATRSANTDSNQIFLTITTLKMLQREHFRRAETYLQEGLLEKYLTVEGLPSGFRPRDVGSLFHLIDNELDATTVAENSITLKLLYDSSGNPSRSLTAVLYDMRITKPMLDFIERRTTGPPAAQNIFFRRGCPEIPVWASLTVARTPKIQNILKMLRLCGFSKHQAEHLILSCLNRTIEANCPDISHRVKAVRISDIRFAVQHGWNHQDKLFQTPIHIPWEDGLIEVCFDEQDSADLLLSHPWTLTITSGELSLPTLTAEIVLRRKPNRNELEALQAKELHRLDVLALESVAKSQPHKQLHRVQARIEFTFKNKTTGRRLSAAALNESVSGALGGAMRGIEGVLLPKDRHGDVDLRGNADTFIWVSDLGPETDTESQYGERLLAALSTHGEVPVVGGCFSSIRVKSGQPSQVQVVSIEENPPLTVDDVALSIETYLFTSGPAFLPA